jgi:hypothetical protein
MAATEIPELLVVALAGLLVLVFLACSLRFYVRGEFITLRTQLRNFATALLAGAAVALVVAPVAARIWAARESRQTNEWWASPSGRTGIAITRAPNHPWLASVRAIELDTGRTMSTIRTPGLLMSFFSQDNVVFAYRDMTTFARRRSDRLAMYTPRGEKIREVDLPGQEIVDTGVLDDGMVIVVADDGTKIHVYRWKDDLEQVAEAAADHPSKLFMYRGIILLANRAEENRAWRLRENGEAIALPWAKVVSAERVAPNVFRDVVYPGRDSMVRYVEKELPVPRQPGDTITYALPSPWLAGDIDYLWALRRTPGSRLASILLLAPASTTWQLVTSSVSVVDDKQGGPGDEYQLAALACADRHDRVAYVDDNNGTPLLRLFDARAGRTVDVKQLETVDRAMRVILQAQGKSLSVITTTRRDTTDVTHSAISARFAYDGTRLDPLPNLSGTIVARRPDGVVVSDTMMGFMIAGPGGVRQIKVR